MYKRARSPDLSLGFAAPPPPPPSFGDPWDDVLIESTSATPTLFLHSDDENNSADSKTSFAKIDLPTPLSSGLPMVDLQTKPIVSRAYPVNRGYGSSSSSSVLPLFPTSSSPSLRQSSSASVASSKHNIEDSGEKEDEIRGRGSTSSYITGGGGGGGVSAFTRLMKKPINQGRPKFDEIATTLLFGTSGRGGGGLHQVIKPTSRPSLNSSSSSSSSSSTPFFSPPSSSSSPPPPPSPRELCQSFLDLGQRSFDSHTCFECGMAYCPGLKDDVTAHEKHCAKVALKKLSNLYIAFTLQMRDENVVWTGRLPLPESGISQFSSSIICIRSSELSSSSSSSQRGGGGGGGSSSSSSSFASSRVLNTKIDEINALLERHLGSESFPKPSAVNDGKVAYLLMVENKKVVGVAVTEPIQEAKLLTRSAAVISETAKTDPQSSQSPSPIIGGGDIGDARVSDIVVKVSLGIAQIWVHEDHRRRGIATRLLDTGRASAFFAYEVNKNEVAFSMPTSGGLALARAYLDTMKVPIYF